MYALYGLDDEQLGMLRSLGPKSYLGLPLIARGQVIGSMMLVHSCSSRRYLDEDVEYFERLADACALSLENARLFEHERDIALQLQAALLPLRLPDDPRVQLTSFYEAGHAAGQIGGDWYDAFRLGPDRIALVVGDVVGGGLTAATAMAELRVAMRAYASESYGVSDTLSRLNRYASSVEHAFASSVVYAEVNLSNHTMTFGCAGHLPPMLVAPDRRVSILWQARGCLLAVKASGYREATVAVPPGSTIVFYTDGLVERRGSTLDEGLTGLVAALGSGNGPIDPAYLAARLGSALHGDDTCILTMHLTRGGTGTVP